MPKKTTDRLKFHFIGGKPSRGPPCQRVRARYPDLPQKVAKLSGRGVGSVPGYFVAAPHRPIIESRPLFLHGDVTPNFHPVAIRLPSLLSRSPLLFQVSGEGRRGGISERRVGPPGVVIIDPCGDLLTGVLNPGSIERALQFLSPARRSTCKHTDPAWAKNLF